MTACPLGLAGQCYCANQVSSFVSPEGAATTAVLLLAHGSPENPAQVPEFLSYVTGGRSLPSQVVEEIRHRYSLIGFSPLACWTFFQADQLSQSLRSQSLKMPVFVGMLVASSIGLFMIPMLYVVFQSMREWSHRRLENKRKRKVGSQVHAAE